jgi:hypothetical protein
MARYKVDIERAGRLSAKRYGHMRILRDGRVRFSKGTGDSDLEFNPNRYAMVSGKTFAYYDSSKYTISVWTDGTIIYVFTVRRNRIAEGLFPALLSPSRLKSAVELMIGAGFSRWVRVGLEGTLRSLSLCGIANARKVAAVRRLLGHCP